MSDPEVEIRAAEERIFAAIRSKDAAALADELTGDFVHSSPGGLPDQAREAFLRAIRETPFEIVSLGGEDLRVRVLGDGVVLSGIQVAQVRLADGTLAAGRSAFVDLFVRSGGRWRLRHAVSVEL